MRYAVLPLTIWALLVEIWCIQGFEKNILNSFFHIFAITLGPFCTFMKNFGELSHHHPPKCSNSQPQISISSVCSHRYPVYRTSPLTPLAKAWISCDVTHYYIWYPDVQLQDGRTLAPSLSKILLVLQTFPASCWCFTFLFSYFCLFLCFLSVTDQSCFCFILCHYKIACT